MSRDDEQQPLDPDVREALVELQRYLSDSLAPLMVSDSINLLLDYPAELAAEEIQAWTTAQFRRAQPAPVSDYLYHAVEKIHAMGQYHLVPKDALARYLEDLKLLVLEQCPAPDRPLLLDNLARLGKTESVMAAPVEILRRQGTLSGAEGGLASAPGGQSSGEASHLRELSILIDRLGPFLATVGGGPASAPSPAAGGAAAPAGGAREAAAAASAAGAALVGGAGSAAFKGASPERRDVLLSQILSVAAMAARTDAELRGALDKLRSMGVDVPTSELFRTLGRAVPQWPVSAPSGPLEQALAAAKGAPTAAMRRVVTLSENPEEVARRFGEMVSAAVEQLNQGSLARAARMFDAADKIIAENRVDASAVESTRRRAQEALDLERVRSLGEDARNHETLARILSFFPGLTASRLIEDLHTEEKRDRRRLLLSLLEMHGSEARATALSLLVAGRRENPAEDWHFKRNLLYLIRRIPRGTEEPTDSELDVLILLANPQLPPPLVKEAIAGLGVARHEKSEAALVTIVQGLETMLLRKGDAPFDEAELQPLLDRAVSALARFGSATARRVVVEHGLRRKGGLGDAGARLGELSGQDLSDDPELVAVLLRGLRTELPFKVFGLTLKKRDDKIGPIIDALSSTPLPQVRKALEEVVERHPGTDFARSAARAIASFDVPRPDENAPGASLTGDLAIFELPSLLQSLAASEVTGTLTLRNTAGGMLGRLILASGRIGAAESGLLRGDEACYQLFERPGGGTFAFVKQASVPAAEGDAAPREVVPVLLEGMRRYDEFQRLSAVVPDDAVLKSTERKPSTEPEEPDPTFQKAIWARASAGQSPRAIEGAVAGDSFRIRRMLARWVEEGSLKPA